MEKNPISWITPKARIMRSGMDGKGLFAVSAIQKDEIVVVWKGTYVNEQQAKRARCEGRIVMQWDDDLFSIEDRGEDIGYYINHSCNSNLWMQDAYTLVARLEIKEGDEITVDYALFEAEDDFISGWECNCGSSFCRARVTGKDWQLKAVQERYANHFSPLINKKISRQCKGRRQ
jgi:hypothetical protein